MSTAPALHVAAGIERRLALEILRGQRPPGSQLPPVRELARVHGVTAPTIQRVVDRLEASGLVSARRGSGVTVNEPERTADLSLLPLRLEALAGQPERCAAVFADFLELRRLVTGHLVRTAATRIARAAPALVGHAMAVAQATTLDEVVAADLAFSGAVVDAAGQTAVAAIFHTAARLVREVPHVQEALYGDRAYHRKLVRNAAAAFARTPASAAAAELEELLTAWDRRSVSRFRAALG